MQQKKKVCGLCRTEVTRPAFDADVNDDAGQKETYRNAYNALKQGDHYSLIMIDASSVPY